MSQRATHLGLLLALLLSLMSCSEDEPNASNESEPAVEHPDEEHAANSDEGPFSPRSDADLVSALESAQARAQAGGKKLLVELGANWCPDCREVARLGTVEPAAALLAEEYETVIVDVGRFDRHTPFLEAYGVDRIATLLVFEADGTLTAKTTLEPISSRSGMTAQQFATWLEAPSGGVGPTLSAALAPLR